MKRLGALSPSRAPATTARADAGDCVTMIEAAISDTENWHPVPIVSMKGIRPPLAKPNTTIKQTVKQMTVTADVMVMMRRKSARSSGRYSSAPADIEMNARAK